MNDIMKRHIWAGLAVIAACACTREMPSTGQGGLRPSLRSEWSVFEETRSSQKHLVSEFTQVPSEGDFTLTVKERPDETTVWNGKITEHSTEILYAIGNYSAEVSCGNIEEEGFDKPYFFGKTDFAIEGGKTSDVSIEAKLANSIVRIQCSEGFCNYYPEHEFKIVSSSGTEIPFVKGETRGAFIAPYAFTVKGSFKTQSGVDASFEKKYSNSDITEGTLYTIKFDVTNVGGVNVTITFNNNCETVNIEEDLNE